MVHPDLQYQGILREILENGIWQSNRTQFKAKFIPSATIVHDLRNGFPVLTTKQLFFKQSIGENIAFIHGAESAKDFRDLGCHFWDSDDSTKL